METERMDGEKSQSRNSYVKVAERNAFELEGFCASAGTNAMT